MNSTKVRVLSEGIAIGELKELTYHITAETNPLSSEKEKLKLAIQKSIDEIEDIKKMDHENEDYLTMQVVLLSDSILIEKTDQEIDNGKTAAEGIIAVLGKYMNSLLDATSEYLKERAFDLSDVKERILKNLSGISISNFTTPGILFAEELYPSFLIQNRKNLLGVITRKGGYSSHSAILCRQFHIPFVITEQNIDASSVVIDTRKQQVILNPTNQEIEHYYTLLKSLSEEIFLAVPHSEFQFLANVSENQELKDVKDYGFDGIGLYRTEMIFMHSNRPLTLEEQYEIYSEAVEQMQEKKICFRTFDIGDDKQLSYVETYKKGVENYVRNPILFRTQIEALLRANRYNTIKIMFPMIYSSDEFIFLKEWVLRIQKEMKNTSHLEFGIMLETQEALENIETFTDVDFISIGTNDLVVDIYHIHRDDQTEALNAYLKDLLFKLKRVVEFCETHHIILSVCGELAAIETALRELIRIGIKNFSVTPPAIKVLNHIYKEFF